VDTFKLYALQALQEEKTLPNDVQRVLVDVYGETTCLRQTTKSSTQIENLVWPMGVTIVGIHKLSVYEKIHTNNVAHMTNDELTR
jgi:hypothetical protein